MAQHRQAAQGRARRVLAWSVLVLGILLCMAWAHGTALRTQAVSECLPDVPAYSTGHMHFNPCAALDATQVQDRRDNVPRWTDGVAVCMAEDGSTPGQAFPCRWDATYQGNGTGVSFTLQAAAQ